MVFMNYLGVIGPHGWPYHWGQPWWWGQPVDEDGTGPLPWLSLFINNIYLVTLAGLLMITAGTHPEQAFSLPYGPFLLVPTINVVARLYYNNAPAPALRKVKK
jgi:hypothetical protein